MTAALYDYPMSRARFDARAALTSPKGRSAAELAGHVVLLQLSGEYRDECMARDFLREYEGGALGLYLDSRAPQPETPLQVAKRHRKDFPLIGLYGLIGAGVCFVAFMVGLGVV